MAPTQHSFSDEEDDMDTQYASSHKSSYPQYHPLRYEKDHEDSETKEEDTYHQITVGHDIYDIKRRYTNLKAVGSGAYGIVCSAHDTLTGTHVAIKKISDTFADLVDAKRILREIKLLTHLKNHDNLIEIVDVMTLPPHTVDFDDIYIVTNLFESDLERIISSTQSLSNAHYQYFLYQLLRGLKYIHSAGVLHRDLKPANALVNANCDLAICDFGLARGIQTTRAEDLTEYVVTRWYRAPELLTDCDTYGPAVDVWSIGCLFAEMLRRKPFFQGNNPSHQLLTIIEIVGSPTESSMDFITHKLARKAILKLGYYPKRDLATLFPNAEADALDLLAQMLTFNPADRVSVDIALKHPYLAHLHSPTEEPTCFNKFNYDFEKKALETGSDIPKHELQRLMYDEMLDFQRKKNIHKPSSTSSENEERHLRK